MEEGIKRLLDSELEADNLLGWEMIKAKKVPFDEVMDYVENTKIPTSWSQKYLFDGKKFYRNPSTLKGGSVTLGGTLSGQTYPGYGLTVTSTGIPTWTDSYTTYTTGLDQHKYELEKSKLKNEIQAQKELAKSRGLRANIKNVFKPK